VVSEVVVVVAVVVVALMVKGWLRIGGRNNNSKNDIMLQKGRTSIHVNDHLPSSSSSSLSPII